VFVKGTSADRAQITYAFSAAVLALVLWSGSAIANKVAVAYMSGLTAGVLRSMLAGAVAMVVALMFRLPRPSAATDRFLLIASGLASFAVWPALMSVGIERTTASHAAIIMAMIPVFTVLIAHMVERRLPQPGWWLGAAAAFVATVILVMGKGSSSTSYMADATVAGDLIILTGCMVCALGYVAGGKLSGKIGSVATTFWGLASALFLLVPVFALVATDTSWSDVPAEGWMAIGWMTILSSLAGYGLWFYALGKVGIAKIGSLQLASPVVTIVAAALVLGEAITTKIAFTTVVIIAGTWWAHSRAS